MFGKPIQPIDLPDSTTIEEQFHLFFRSSTNVISSYVTLPVRIMFIRFDSHGIQDKNLGKRDSKTRTALLQDVDVIFRFQAQYHRGRATMQSKILVEVGLHVNAKLEN